MIEVKDRVPTYPGRMKLTKQDGSSEYVTLERADSPTQAGTPINKALFDSIAADIAKKLSLTGGTVTGPVIFRHNGAAVELQDTDSGRKTKLHKNASASADYGTYLADYTNTEYPDVVVLRKAATQQDKLKLLVRDASGATSEYPIYGTHNKTWGTYTGNGVATVRQVNTSGYGFACIVRGGGGTSIVLGSGVMRVSGGTFSWLPSGQAYFKNGILYIASTDSALNTSGTSYTYEVL